MSLLDVNKLGQPAKTFGRMIILAIIIAIFYFLSNEFGKYFGNFFPTNQSEIQSEARKSFLASLTFDYKITKVIDGDTVDIVRVDGENFSNGKKTNSVRLIGINSPETVDPRKPVECFGKEASAYLKDLANGKEAALEIDNSQGIYDKYGRALAYIYIKTSGVKDENFLMLNSEMIKNGYAYQYTYDLPYKYQEEFKLLEIDARKNNLGLWSPETCGGLKIPVAPPAKNNV